MGKYLNMTEFAREKYGDGAYEQMVGPGTSGRLKRADGADAISIVPTKSLQGKRPYFPKVPRIREIAYCARGVCDGGKHTFFGVTIYNPRAGMVQSSTMTDFFWPFPKLGNRAIFWTHVFQITSKDRSHR